ncbi:hypothetical protein A1O7_02212 [Cladophialophora yegresii CBS 114405]|uniref:Uncharacterized protein n=1 Tax=Cladophialophora yegresii CBS 114405 TaxID=1182544 RepID=W9W129_9EURO|nr:uncharacterized protein A1O7_02212 [Cladophialophora yegresii CBS 114405]EXJ61782.1 hypothetical protein A1O7_02212 [Cladophialophora yegresii CBS 114405]
MPNKKSKNASKALGKTTMPSTAAAASHVPRISPLPNTSDDFRIKNAEAKSLIMATLVPGSEAWRIAEPIELASTIMKTLEARYAPKDAAGNPLRGKDLVAWTATNKSKNELVGLLGLDIYDGATSTEFIEDFVAGKPMDKYMNLYREKLAVAQANRARLTSSRPPAADDPRKTPAASIYADPSKTGWDEMRPVSTSPPTQSMTSPAPQAPSASQSQPQAHPPLQSPDEEDLPIPETFHLPPQLSTSPLTAGSNSSRWQAHPVKHESYLSEQQATLFAHHDVDRKKQIQVAATKVLMQKLPTRDLRLLWAVLYGGDDAPWPGSCSSVIPGVTSLQWGGKDYEIDHKTCVWSWNNKAEEKG